MSSSPCRPDSRRNASSPYWRWNNTAFAAVRGQPEVRALERSWQDSRTWSVNESLHTLLANHPVFTSFRALLNSTLIPPLVVNTCGLVQAPLLPGYDTGAYLTSFATDGSVVSLIDKNTGNNYASSVNRCHSSCTSGSTSRSSTPPSPPTSPAATTTASACATRPRCCPTASWGWTPPSPPPPLPHLVRYSLAHFYVQNDTKTPSAFLFNLSLPANVSALHTDVGAPSSVVLRYSLSPGLLAVDVTLYNCTTTRVPDALYLLFHPRASKGGGDELQVRKLGQWMVEREDAHVGNASVNAWGVREARVDGYWELNSTDTGLMVRNLTTLPILERERGEGGEGGIW